MKINDSNTYNVKRLTHYYHGWWLDAAPAAVETFPWPSAAGYRPKTKAWLGTDGASLFVYMETDETDLRAENKGFGYVHFDSCMEFFFAPLPESSPQYLNFEFNPAGGMYLSIGTQRHERTKLPEDNYREFFNVITTIPDKGWNLEYCVPLSFLKRFFPALELLPGHRMKGNFYKCGEKTLKPHFGCWAPIDLPKPDFHCPRFFGTLILE